MEIGAAHAFRECSRDIPNPYGLKLVLATSDDRNNRKGADHCEEERDHVVTGAIHIPRTNDYPPAGEVAHDLFSAALRSMVRRLARFGTQRRDEDESSDLAALCLADDGARSIDVYALERCRRRFLHYARDVYDEVAPFGTAA